jgi:hypothetical protein
MFRSHTAITIEVLSLAHPHAKYVSPYPDVNKYSNNLEAIFKFYAPDDCNEAGSIPRTQIISRHRIKSIRPGELATRIFAHLAVSRTILNAMYCSHYLNTGGHAVAPLVEALRYKLQVRGFDSRCCHWSFSWTYSFRPHYGLLELSGPAQGLLYLFKLRLKYSYNIQA